ACSSSLFYLLSCMGKRLHLCILLWVQCFFSLVSVYLATVPKFLFYFADWVNLSSCRVFDYHFVDQPLTWTEAQTYCRQRYVDLATIHNSEQIAQLLNTLSSFGHASEVWVGLFYKIHWAWSDGFSGSGADYRSWKTSDNEPNFASASQFCVCTDGNGTWWDDFCGNHYPFLCYNGNRAWFDIL
uniref:C-type lectin domain-containing protein n=1 Tax=Fundulus heteroclitus TaxID=8078 RepID=A0A3Q2PZ40_FUNHE